MNVTLGAGDEEKGQPVLGLAFAPDMGGSGQGARGAAGFSLSPALELVARAVAARADEGVGGGGGGIDIPVNDFGVAG